MKVRSFTTVAIRLMGLMSILYGLLMVAFMLITYSMFSEGRMEGLGSVFFIQFLLPGIMIVFGIILILASRALGDSLSKGLED